MEGWVQLPLTAALPQEPWQQTQLHHWSWPMATSIPARSLPSLGYSLTSHDLPSSKSPNPDDFASSATNSPCKPIWDDTDGHGVEQ